MDLQTSGLVFVILLSSTFGIELIDHGYTGVLIAINPNVPEDPALLENIKDMLKNASDYLYNAVGNRFYFKEVTITVPANWNATSYKKATTERYIKAHVFIDEPNPAYGDEPYTLQYGQCGNESQYIHLTPNFLLDDQLTDVYGERGRVFVHEWAHLRWGLYDEYSEEEPFYLSGEGKVEATRCSINITGQQCMPGDCKPCETNITTGLPTSDCMFVVNNSSSAKESIMAIQGLDIVITQDKDTLGDEIVILTDGEATDVIKDCEDAVIGSKVMVHTIALGPNSDKTLQNISTKTYGQFLYAAQSLDSNELVDAFASLTASDGNLTHQIIQLESSGTTTTDWFNGTFAVDWTVGNGTVITIVYEAHLPSIFIRSPNGDIFNGSHFSHDVTTKTLSLKIPGTAEVGEWHYSLLNERDSEEAMAITVITRAASADVAPIVVKAHMDQKSSDGSKAMVVYAAVTQKGLPVIMADVTATLESDTNHKASLQLVDSGAGADAFKHDGIYSAYFSDLMSGRYSLKVRVKNTDKARISMHRNSGAMYIPGYVVNGQVVMNPPKPPVNHEPVEVGSFSRTATGESFVVALPPGSTGPPPFPPCKITDLKANLEGDNVTLTWTAPGASYDQGTASLYHIHWSEDLGLLRGQFDKSEVVNTSALSPQEAGSVEEYTFSSYHFNITNGTSVYFAIAAENAEPLQSEMSNIARVVKFEPPVPHKSIDMIAVAVSGTVAVIVVMIAGIVIVHM
ncbi:calcium-activated chloride channel regulator 1-like [Sardina pilchardus]|uniref:calcium-activated chloride channel regulator 1-like n=1 Tax=Sardina pilchardus TaxID=27697 RepID=UPI002E10C4D1